MKKSLLLSLVLTTAGPFAEAKSFYAIHVYNGIHTGDTGDTSHYTISSSEALMVKAWQYYSLPNPHIDSTSAVNWYVDGVYQFTAGGMVTFNQPGVISFGGSFNFVQLSVTIGIDDQSSSELPFPFTQVPRDVNLKNLRYTVLDLLGNIIDEGVFSGKTILRDAQPVNPLPPGIYYVIYYDALDNRQVLTDKISYSRQP